MLLGPGPLLRRARVSALTFSLLAGPASGQSAPSSEEDVPSGRTSTGTRHNGWRDPLNQRDTASMSGGVGLLRLGSADLGPPEMLRFIATGELSRLQDFPVPDVRNTRTAATFAVSFVPLPFLEVFASYGAWANTSTGTAPRLIQSQGDVNLGAKITHAWFPGFWAGVDLRVLSFSDLDSSAEDGYSLGFAPRLIATYDARPHFPRLPLRAHGQLGFLLDGSGQATRLTAAEEFALDAQRYDRFSLGLGVEAPLPWVTPFLEYQLGYPMGVPDGALVDPTTNEFIHAGAAAAQTLGLGVKVTALRDVTFQAVAEWGLSPKVGLGVPATPGFNFLLGASFNVDLTPRHTRIVEVQVEREAAPIAAPPPLKISGRVVEEQSHKPIPGVIIVMEDMGLPPVATDAHTGAFLTHALPAGTLRLRALKDGYRPLEQEVQLSAEGDPSQLELTLEKLAPPARLDVTVSAHAKPVAATVSWEGTAEGQLTTPSSGPALSQELPAGRYKIKVVAPGFLAQLRDVNVEEGASLGLHFDLVAQPGTKVVSAKEDKLEFTVPLRFVPAKATLLPESLPLIAQIVDVMAREGIERLRIESHTDNRGEPHVNLQLSEDRAKAVAALLAKTGLNPERFEAQGFGETRPLAPNLTPRGRELNQRVELLILSR